MKKYFFLSLPLLSLVFSCKKSLRNETRASDIVSQLIDGSTKPGDPSDTTTKSYLFLDFREDLGSIDNNSKVSVTALGSFYDNSTRAICMGDMIINNTHILPDGSNLYDKAFSGNDYSTALNWPGTDIKLAFDGNCGGGGGGGGFDPIDDTVHVPPLFNPNGLDLVGSSLSINYDANFTWTPDPKNKYKQVAIEIRYLPVLSQNINGSFPNSIPNLIYYTPDNGQFTIPHADLQRFPVGSLVRITMIRATDVQKTSRKPRYRFVVTTQAMTPPLMIK